MPMTTNEPIIILAPIFHPLATCAICGDDIEIHDWITADDCDRNDD